MRIHRRFWVIALVGVLSHAVAAEPLRKPESVLITISAVDGAGIEPKMREAFEGIYNEFAKQVMERIQAEFQADGIPARVYVHQDRGKGVRPSVQEQLFSGRHDGLVQLEYKFEGGASGNRTLLVCHYMRLAVPPSRWQAGAQVGFESPYSKTYVVISENTRDSPRTGTIGADFMRGVRQTYGPAAR